MSTSKTQKHFQMQAIILRDARCKFILRLKGGSKTLLRFKTYKICIFARCTWYRPFIRACLHEGVGPGSLVCGFQLPGWWANHAVCQRELDLGVVELLRVLTLAQRHRDRGGLDDLDARGAHPVTRSHLIVHLLHCSVECQITVFLVHVVVTSPTLVTHPDTEVFDGGGVLLENLK